MLKKSIEKVFDEKKGLKEIVAFVSEENIASKKIFQGLGFSLVEKQDNMLKLILQREVFYV